MWPDWIKDRAAAERIAPAAMRDDDLTLAAVMLREHAEEIVQRSHTDASIAASERIAALADRLDAYADLD